jgi:hypothetical protein
VAAFATTPKRCRLPGKRCRFEHEYVIIHRVFQEILKFSSLGLTLTRSVVTYMEYKYRVVIADGYKEVSDIERNILGKLGA